MFQDIEDSKKLKDGIKRLFQRHVQNANTQSASAAGADGFTPTMTPWLAEGTSVQGSTVLALGPEPIIERQQLVLLQGGQSLRIVTDGLRGFSADAAVAEGAAP